MSIPGIMFQIFGLLVRKLTKRAVKFFLIVYEEKRSIKMMVTPLTKTGYDGRELK